MYTTQSSTTSSYTETKGNKKPDWMKKQRQLDRNEELRSLYPAYQPSSTLEIIHVHHQSTIQSIEDLIQKAGKTRRFVVDTESQWKILRKGEPRTNGALIQIQMIHSTINSTVMIIETCYLPDTQSMLYKKIKQLCDIIFNNNNEIITWGPVEQEFDPFHHLNLIHLGAIHKCDLQFYISNPSQIYDTHPAMEKREMTENVSMEIDTFGYELIIHIDDDDEDFDYEWGNFKQKPKMNLPLGLQTVVAEQLQKFLDKSYTMNEWNCGLDLNLETWRRRRFSKGRYNEHEEKQEREQMLHYAVNDCASVAELYFQQYPDTINDYLTPPETPTTTTAATNTRIVQTPEIVVPVEHETSEPSQQSQQHHELQQPAPAEKKQPAQRTEEEQSKRKKEIQRRKNDKFKEKKRNRPDFIHPIIRPIYYRYDYRKIRAQLQEDQVHHSHQIHINEEKTEVKINFKSEELKEDGKKKVPISYFTRTQYYKRWGGKKKLVIN